MNRPGIPEPPTCHSRQAWFPKRESAQGSADPRLWFWSSANGCPVASQVGDSNRKRGVEMTDRSQGTPRHAEPRRTQQERLLETRALSLELARPALRRGHDRPGRWTTQAPPNGTSPTSPGSSRPSSSPSTCPATGPSIPTFNYCFNSYYESQGPRQPRPKRGVLTRPSMRTRPGLSRPCGRGRSPSCWHAASIPGPRSRG